MKKKQRAIRSFNLFGAACLYAGFVFTSNALAGPVLLNLSGSLFFGGTAAKAPFIAFSGTDGSPALIFPGTGAAGPKPR